MRLHGERFIDKTARKNFQIFHIFRDQLAFLDEFKRNDIMRCKVL